jgi:hypothetical protein
MTDGVAPDYTHRDKSCAAGERVAAGQAQLKWYEIAYPEVAISETVRQAARDFLRKQDMLTGLGFAILHRCGGPGFYFLIACTWRSENELWEVVFVKHSDTDPGFSLFPLPGPQRGTFCVWELGVVNHEQQAWRRYLLSERGDTAQRAYLEDRFAGAV